LPDAGSKLRVLADCRVSKEIAVKVVVPDKVVVVLVKVVVSPKVILVSPSDPRISSPFILRSPAIVKLPKGVILFAEEKNCILPLVA
jgi:hypothetical protein